MQILSVNVGDVREVTVKNRVVKTGIYKEPTMARVRVSRLGLETDVRVLPRRMGEEHHAVYAYPYEHYAYWQAELERDAFPMGQFGENLTITGLLEEEVRIGDVFRFGNTVLQVAQPRIPCGRLNQRMGLRFAPMFLASRKVGYYLRVLEEGDVAQGDPIELLERDEASPTMEEFVRIVQYEYWDAEGLRGLLRARDLMPAWREIVETKLARAESSTGWHGLREFEVASRREENKDVASLYLKCPRGRPLAPFRAGQRLTVVLGGRGLSGDQRRRNYSISSSPEDLSSYRITVCQVEPPGEKASAEQMMSSYLLSLGPGARIWCISPHGPFTLDGIEDGRIPVLLSQGVGIAPMASFLYELEQRKASGAYLFHESCSRDPLCLLQEVSDLLSEKEGFHMYTAPAAAAPTPAADGRDRLASLSAEAIVKRVPRASADFYIAGVAEFVYRQIAQLNAAGVDAATIRAERFN